MARPIPLLEPVTMATLPVRSNSDITLSSIAARGLLAMLPVSIVHVRQTSIGPNDASATHHRLSSRGACPPAASGLDCRDRRLDPDGIVRRARAEQPDELRRH